MIDLNIKDFNLDDYDAVNVQSSELKNILNSKIDRHLIFSGVMDLYLNNKELNIDDSYWCVFEPEVLGPIHSTFAAFGANVQVALTGMCNASAMGDLARSELVLKANSNALRQALSVSSEFVVAEIDCSDVSGVKEQIEDLQDKDCHGYLMFADRFDALLDGIKIVKQVDNKPVIASVCNSDTLVGDIDSLMDAGCDSFGVVFDTFIDYVSNLEIISRLQDDYSVKALVTINDCHCSGTDELTEYISLLRKYGISLIRAGRSTTRVDCASLYAQF